MSDLPELSQSNAERIGANSGALLDQLGKMARGEDVDFAQVGAILGEAVTGAPQQGAPKLPPHVHPQVTAPQQHGHQAPPQAPPAAGSSGLPFVGPPLDAGAGRPIPVGTPSAAPSPQMSGMPGRAPGGMPGPAPGGSPGGGPGANMMSMMGGMGGSGNPMGMLGAMMRKGGTPAAPQGAAGRPPQLGAQPQRMGQPQPGGAPQQGGDLGSALDELGLDLHAAAQEAVPGVDIGITLETNGGYRVAVILAGDEEDPEPDILSQVEAPPEQLGAAVAHVIREAHKVFQDLTQR